MRARALVVGAGLSGLNCALELHRGGVSPSLFEGDHRVGGRVQTDELDGFLLDRGFQVLLTAYPETRRTLDEGRLQLRPFFPGALIVRGGGLHLVADPWRRPAAAIASLIRGTVGFADGLRMARFRARVRSSQRRRQQPTERTTLQRLRAEGFSDTLIQTFFRPFFGGVFLESNLETSERQLEFVFRMFSTGDIAVPARGMGQISDQLAAMLPPGTVRTGRRVTRVSASEVELQDGERVPADAVVVATDAADAIRLGIDADAVEWRGVTCLYFAAATAPVRGPKLILNGEGRGPVNNLCVMSEVAPELAPRGQALVSVTVLDTPNDGDLETAVRRQLTSWFGKQVDEWRHLRTYRIERALPDQSPPRPPHRPPRLPSGVYVCGDHRHDSSINGAMASGRETALAVLHDLLETRQ